LTDTHTPNTTSTATATSATDNAASQSGQDCRGPAPRVSVRRAAPGASQPHRRLLAHCTMPPRGRNFEDKREAVRGESDSDVMGSGVL
jgi:hypothetical protein